MFDGEVVLMCRSSEAHSCPVTPRGVFHRRALVSWRHSLCIPLRSAIQLSRYIEEFPFTLHRDRQGKTGTGENGELFPLTLQRVSRAWNLTGWLYYLQKIHISFCSCVGISMKFPPSFNGHPRGILGIAERLVLTKCLRPLTRIMAWQREYPLLVYGHVEPIFEESDNKIYGLFTFTYSIEGVALRYPSTCIRTIRSWKWTGSFSDLQNVYIREICMLVWPICFSLSFNGHLFPDI